MKKLLAVIALLLVSSAASAQATPEPPPCWPSSHIDKVTVEMVDGTVRRGSLLCFGTSDLTLVEKSAVGRFSLAEVRQVRKVADPVWDGALKGASVGLVMLIFGCPAECALRTAAGYGLIGLIVDAIDTNRDTVYRPATGPRASLGFRVRF